MPISLNCERIPGLLPNERTVFDYFHSSTPRSSFHYILLY